MKYIKAASQNGFIAPEFFFNTSSKRQRPQQTNIFSEIWQLFSTSP
jgi:hypothetical protein